MDSEFVIGESIGDFAFPLIYFRCVTYFYCTVFDLLKNKNVLTITNFSLIFKCCTLSVLIGLL